MGNFFLSMQMKNLSLFVLLALAAVAATQLWSCGCDSYNLFYTYSGGSLTINDNLDYTKDSTATIETPWKPAENEVLSSTVKVGLVFTYDYNPEPGSTTCEPTQILLRDSVKGVDIVTVYDLEGIAAGESILATGGWDATKIDSLLEYMNQPFYPSYANIFLSLGNKPVEGIFQLKAIITKTKNKKIEVLSDELKWE